MIDIIFIILCIVLFRIVQSANREVVHIKKPPFSKNKPRLDELVSWIMSAREMSSIRLNTILYCLYITEIRDYGESCIDRPFIAYEEGFMIKELRDIFGTTKEYAKVKPISDKKAKANPEVFKKIISYIWTFDDYTDENLIKMVRESYIYVETYFAHEDRVLTPEIVLEWTNQKLI